MAYDLPCFEYYLAERYRNTPAITEWTFIVFHVAIKSGFLPFTPATFE